MTQKIDVIIIGIISHLVIIIELAELQLFVLQQQIVPIAPK